MNLYVKILLSSRVEQKRIFFVLAGLKIRHANINMNKKLKLKIFSSNKLKFNLETRL